jgi:Uma2 family endonuclease
VNAHADGDTRERCRETDRSDSARGGRIPGEVHRDLMIDLIFMLKQRDLGDPPVCVAGNLLLYYVQGDPTQCVSPDVFAVFGVEDRQRPSYKLWEEEHGPRVVIEVTSASTQARDLGVKKGLYAFLGVRECFLVDPLGEHVEGRLAGYRLTEEGTYVARREADARASGRALKRCPEIVAGSPGCKEREDPEAAVYSTYVRASGRTRDAADGARSRFLDTSSAGGGCEGVVSVTMGARCGSRCAHRAGRPSRGPSPSPYQV